MSTLKSSKQRDAVLENLQSRYDHPTAEDVFLAVREVIPSISLATVYRNLKLLESEGIILKIPTGDSDRFDGHTHGHYHLTCLNCRGVPATHSTILTTPHCSHEVTYPSDVPVRGHHLPESSSGSHGISLKG